MKSPPRPFRFLILVVAGWVGIRGALFAFYGWAPGVRVAPPAVEAPVRVVAVEPPEEPLPFPVERFVPVYRPFQVVQAVQRRPIAAPVQLTLATPPAPLAVMAVVSVTAPVAQPAALAPPPPGASRWSVSAWLFVREGGRASLGPSQSLGGSQAGTRLLYNLQGDLALSVRAYAPLSNPEAADVALGVDWKPVKSVPVRLLAERRQALGGEGRSGFSLLAYGGVSDAPAGPLVVDAYGQAGVIGLRSRDLFADGSIRLSATKGRLKAGAGAWAAAQPGASRVDAGPQASLSIPLGKTSVTIAADWRFRLAGDAEPGSGPALTLSTDF